MCDIDQTLNEIRLFCGMKRWTPRKFATVANLSPGALRSLWKPEWSPSVETIRQLQAIVKDEKS